LFAWLGFGEFVLSIGIWFGAVGGRSLTAINMVGSYLINLL